MTVEVTSEELKTALMDDEVRELIVKKISEMKTEGLADSVTVQYKSLGIEPDSTEPTSTSDAAIDQSTADSSTTSAEATA